MWLAVMLTGGPVQMPQTSIVWVALLFLGVVGSGFAFILCYGLIHEIGPTRTSMIAYLFPLGGVLLGVVFLREPLTWQNSTLISDDVVDQIAKLKRQPGKDIAVLGSGELVQLLIRHGLVDELALTVDPIVLGTGKRLFRDGLAQTRFQLVGSVAGDNEVVMLTYRLPDQQA